MTTNTRHSIRKPRTVTNLYAVLILARVEAECLFIYVSEQVERLNRNVSSAPVPTV
jgi:hypothetical protein